MKISGSKKNKGFHVVVVKFTKIWSNETNCFTCKVFFFFLLIGPVVVVVVVVVVVFIILVVFTVSIALHDFIFCLRKL